MKYTKPQITVVKLQQQSMICESPSEVIQISGIDLIFGGGAYADARTREQSMLGEEW